MQYSGWVLNCFSQDMSYSIYILYISLEIEEVYKVSIEVTQNHTKSKAFRLHDGTLLGLNFPCLILGRYLIPLKEEIRQNHNKINFLKLSRYNNDKLNGMRCCVYAIVNLLVVFPSAILLVHWWLLSETVGFLLVLPKTGCSLIACTNLDLVGLFYFSLDVFITLT